LQLKLIPSYLLSNTNAEIVDTFAIGFIGNSSLSKLLLAFSDDAYINSNNYKFILNTNFIY